MDNRTELQQFCDDTEPFDKPFVRGGWMYATNRVVCVRVPCDEPDDELPDERMIKPLKLSWDRFASTARRHIDEGNDGWKPVFVPEFDIALKIGTHYYKSSWIKMLANVHENIEFIDDDHEHLAAETMCGMQALVCAYDLNGESQ